MGGRGGAGASGMGGRGGMFGKEKELTVETTFFRSNGYNASRYSDEVLEASAGGAAGHLKVGYARDVKYSPTAKTNIRVPTTIKIRAGFVNGKPHNINWSKVNKVSGQTYNLRDTLKKQGFRWNNTEKSWVK